MALAVFALPGCGGEKAEYVEVKEVAPEPPPAPSSEPATPAVSAPARDIGFTWTLPEGWTENAPSRMKLLSLSAGRPLEQVAELSVSAFPGDVGGQLANLNRWRRQVGLGPVSEQAMDGFVTPVTIAGIEGWQVDFTGPAGSAPDGAAARVMVAVVMRDGRSWFFKLAGTDAAVEGEKERYSAFLDSVEFTAR